MRGGERDREVREWESEIQGKRKPLWSVDLGLPVGNCVPEIGAPNWSAINPQLISLQAQLMGAKGKGWSGESQVLRNQIKSPCCSLSLSLSFPLSSFFYLLFFFWPLPVGPSAAILRTPINLLRQFGKGKGKAAQESRNFVYIYSVLFCSGLVFLFYLYFF